MSDPSSRDVSSGGGNSVSPWLHSPWKRLIDLVIAVPLSILATPFVVIAAIGIRLTSPGPVLFRQQRAGHRGEPFQMLKLRTMRQPSSDVSSPSGIDDDESRLIRFGRLLRRFSIDELPQLINVLRGDMSIIGPRPLLVQYNERYDALQKCRLLARPGLTGLSQVTMRNAGDWNQKLSVDAHYVSRASLGLDLRIFVRSIRTVVTGAGVSATGHATMPEFNPRQPSPD